MSSAPSSLPDAEGGPLLIVLSGPSGVGKDAALEGLRALNRPWHTIVTATTRSRRLGETDGVEYIFLEHDKFQSMIEHDELLEYAEVYGNWYGVPKQQVRDALAKGLDTVLKVDVQGAATIKKLVPNAVFVFLAPSSMDELRRRLSLRATESAMELETRTSIAWREMEHLRDFDYEVVNRDGSLDEAVARIDAIIQAEKCRIPPHRVSI